MVVVMPLVTYRITLLITRSDGEDETRIVKQEAWSVNEAIRLAEQRVWEEEPEVKDVRSVGVS